jgi:hypothetical protein
LVGVKKRPVLVIKNENSYGDIVCFQITSNAMQTEIEKILDTDLESGSLRLIFFVKYDKCFTLNSSIVEKLLATAAIEFLRKIKNLNFRT